MATTDTTRSAFQARKNYSGVHMQQGRVLTDDDWNDGERIAQEDLRQSRVDIIGPAGSPDDGFKIENPRVAGGLIDFDIRAGTFYLGGFRLELSAGETFRQQADSLQEPAGQHPAPAGERTDLVYLMTYQEPVSAVEDAELFEAALGGADTSVRLRTYRRVFLAENAAGQDCDAAWAALLADWAAQGLGTLTGDDELRPDTTLEVTFLPGGAPDDLCTPAAAGGYLGAENQAIRVQLVDSTHFTWGFNNAAPLYRVQAAADRRTLTLVTDPKDQAHWPLAGQVVEVLPWAAVLPNRQKLAEQAGFLARLDTSYNPDTGQVRLATAIPALGFDDWTGRPDAAALGADGTFYFLRVWDRGADLASDPALAFTPGTPLTLGQTGLQVTISGNDRRGGDYWIIAARPETPDRVVPWDLEDGRPPHGVRRFVTPLALIRWHKNGNAVGADQPLDCRPVFDPLTSTRTCCQLTVGDGVISHGNVDSLEAALQRLPAAGGVLCLLPGFHRANARIVERKNIRISGCGGRSRVAPRPDAASDPIFYLRDSADIIIEGLDLISLEGTGIIAEGTQRAGGQSALHSLEFHDLRFLAYRNAIKVTQGQAVDIHHNLIRMSDRAGGDVAIFILADDARIERNDLGVVPAGLVAPPPPEGGGAPPPDVNDPCADFNRLYVEQRPYLLHYVNFVWTLGTIVADVQNPYQTLGGIQVGSGSQQIRILENNIQGGIGNGITLGSDIDPADFPAGDQPGGQVEDTFKNDRRLIVGRVLLAGKPAAGVSLTLTDTKSGTQGVALSDDSGIFRSDLGAGQIQVSVASPGYRLTGVRPLAEPDQDQVSVEVDLEKAEVRFSLAAVLGYIYEVIIEGNEISQMGLSGIGVPYLTEEQRGRLLELARKGGLNQGVLGLLSLLFRQFGLVTGFVVDLLIEENHIHHCLRRSFDQELQALVLKRGLGGVSLGLCEDLVVRENRIEDSGLNHIGPACGIFVSFALQCEISHNQALNNGPIDLQAPNPTKLIAGTRGGIVVRLAMSRSLSDLFPGASGSPNVITNRAGPRATPEDILAGGRHAARLQANIVEQPIGESLAVIALGALSATNNSFTTQASSQLEANASGLEGGAVTLLNLGRLQITPVLPDGKILFAGNQTSLNDSARSLVAQTIATMDDLGFHENQSTVLFAQGLRVNTLLVSPTVRASNNRLQEPVSGVFSRTALGSFTMRKE